MSLDGIPHPYYPLDAQITGYVANEATILKLLGVASIVAIALLGTTFTLVTMARPSLNKADRLAILWFVLCQYSGWSIVIARAN